MRNRFHAALIAVSLLLVAALVVTLTNLSGSRSHGTAGQITQIKKAEEALDQLHWHLV